MPASATEEDMKDQQESEHLPVDVNPEDPELIDCSEAKDRGVLKKILKPGTSVDTPFDGSTVFVHYVGRLLDGSIFDSSRKRGEPFDFVLGKRNVIKAWDAGVATMKKGEICELYCTSEYAYGKAGSGAKIPPNSTLVFQVELLYWQDEDISPEKNKTIVRRIVKKGIDYSTPNDGAKVNVRLSGLYGGKPFDEREVEFLIGESEENDLIAGIELAVKKMKKLETSLITFHAEMAFGQAGKSEWGIPANAEIQYQITLMNFEKAKEIWSMSAEEKLESAEKAKEKGTGYFTKGNIKSAIKQYERMKELLATDPEFKEEKEERQKKLLALSHLNLAAAHLKQNDFYATRNAANEALQLEPDNVKGLYRRGMALLGLKEFEEAKKDFQRILDLEPENKAAKQQMIVIIKEIRSQAERERKMFRGMFDKFAAEDTKTGKAPTGANGDKKDDKKNDSPVISETKEAH